MVEVPGRSWQDATGPANCTSMNIRVTLSMQNIPKTSTEVWTTQYEPMYS